MAFGGNTPNPSCCRAMDADMALGQDFSVWPSVTSQAASFGLLLTTLKSPACLPSLCHTLLLRFHFHLSTTSLLLLVASWPLGLWASGPLGVFWVEIAVGMLCPAPASVFFAPFFPF